MKKLAILFFYLGSAVTGFCQYEPPVTPPAAPPPAPSPVYYIGVGTGIHSRHGLLGFSFATRIAPNTIAEAHFGYGVWGPKAGISFIAKAFPVKGWCPALGIGRSFGLASSSEEVEVVLNSTTFKATTNIGKNPMNVIYMGMQRHWVNAKGNRAVLDLGYVLPLSDVNATFADTSLKYNGADIPTSQLKFSEKQLSDFNIAGPGSIMIGFSYYFGLGSKH